MADARNNHPKSWAILPPSNPAAGNQLAESGVRDVSPRLRLKPVL